MREHIPSYQLHMGQRIFAVPRDATTPRGPGLGTIPTGGMELSVSDYIFGCVQRAAVIAYEVEALDDEQLAAVTEPPPEKVVDPSAQQAAEKPAEQAPAAPPAEKEGI